MVLLLLFTPTITSTQAGISLIDACFLTVMGLEVRGTVFKQRNNLPLVTLVNHRNQRHGVCRAVHPLQLEGSGSRPEVDDGVR